MPRVTNGLPPTWSVADLLKHFGNIAPRRIRLRPAPGAATEKDLIDIERKEGRLYELVDGVLVEKIMGYAESFVAMTLGHLLQSFLEQHDIGFVVGESAATRLLPGLVRMPDVSFVCWERLSRREVPAEPIADLAPDLAVEVLSRGNTKREMERKLKEYFLAGVRRVWFVDPARRTVEVFTSPDESTVLTEDQTLDGGDVLPGFSLPLRSLFARLPDQPAAKKGAARRKPKASGGRPR